MLARVQMFRFAAAAVPWNKGAAPLTVASASASAVLFTAETLPVPRVHVRLYSSRRYPIPVNPNHEKELAARMRKLRSPIQSVLHPTGLMLPKAPLFDVNLSALPSCKRKRKRLVGRGKGSTRGDRCGRGNKGRKARGKVPLYYEGGQSTFFAKMPVRPGYKELPPVVDFCYLDRIQRWIDTGRLDPSKPITMADLHESRCCVIDTDGIGVRLLHRGAEYFRTPIQIEVAEASPEAIEAIERVGGSIVCRYYNKKQLNVLLWPALLVAPLEIDEPVEWKIREYYMKKENRGRLYWDKNPDDPDRDCLFPEGLRFTHIQPAPTLAYARAFKKKLASSKPFIPKDDGVVSSKKKAEVV